MRKRYVARMYKKKLAPFNDKSENIKIDLCSDYERILAGWVDGFVECRKSENDGVLDYFRLERRLIEAKPRKVRKAKHFMCPPGYEDKLLFIEEYIKSGKNLLPFMSKGIRNLNNEDMLLNDWGIFHLHLSNELEMHSVFMERSDYLLMIHVEDDCIYFLKIVPHEKPNKTRNIWTKKEYLEIIRENWPEIIDKYIMKGMKLLEHFDEREHYELRKAGASVFTELDEDSLYFSPGGGYASDCTSLQAVRARDYHMRLIEDLERVWVYHWGPDILGGARKEHEDIDYLDISLVWCNEKGYFLVENQCKLLFRVTQSEDEWIISRLL